MVTENQLIENGRQLLVTRRVVWNLERIGRHRTASENVLLKEARATYRRLLKERQKMTSSAQMELL